MYAGTRCSTDTMLGVFHGSIDSVAVPVHDAQQIICLVYFMVESIDSAVVRKFELVEHGRVFGDEL